VNIDASLNVVVFEVEIDGKPEKRVGQGPTRADDCVRQIWADLCAKEPLKAEKVSRIYSEWEPSAEDLAYLEANFPEKCQVTFSFERPASPDGWDQALKKVEEQLRQAAMKRAAEEALSTTNNQLDDLLPVLRTAESGDPFSAMIVSRPVGPGLAFFLAHVNWTPRKTIGTRYVMNNDVQALGKTADQLWSIASRNLAVGLQIEAVEVEGERAFLVKHKQDMGASAIGLPDFHANASKWTQAEEVFVGFPNPGVLFVTAMQSAKAVARLRQAVLTSDYWGAVALTPACFRLTSAGLELIAARPAPAEGEGQPG
jgi:hypothetical protein